MKTQKRILSMFLTLLMVFTVVSVALIPTTAAADDLTPIARYLNGNSTAGLAANAIEGSIQYDQKLGMTYFNGARVEITDDPFAGHNFSNGITFAFNYRPNYVGEHSHLISIGKNDRNSGTANHFFISSSTCHTTAGHFPKVEWVNGAGTETINAYPADTIPEIGKEYNIVVSINATDGVVFYIDGEEKTTVYVNDGNPLENVRSFLNEVSGYSYNYLGVSRWGDNPLNGYLSDLRIYGTSMTDTEVCSTVADMAQATTVDFSHKTFNAPAYQHNDPADGVYNGVDTKAYANLAYSSKGHTEYSSEENRGYIYWKILGPKYTVMVYDGVNPTYAPIEAQTKKDGSMFGITYNARYIEINSAVNLFLTNNWTGVWDGAGYDYGTSYYEYWAGRGTNNQSISNTNTNKSSTGIDNTSTYRFWWNKIQYNGNVNTGTYYEYIPSVTFKVESSFSNQNTTLTPASSYYILNYQPIYGILDAAKAKYDNEMAGKDWIYTEQSYAQAALAMRRITLCAPDRYNYNEDDIVGVDASVKLCAAAIKQAFEEYNKINLVKKQSTITINQGQNTSITVTDENGKVINSGDSVDYGTTLTVSTDVAGELAEYPAHKSEIEIELTGEFEHGENVVDSPEITVSTNSIDHTKGSPVITEVDATCTEDGSRKEVVSCTVCGKELSNKTETITSTGHSYKEHAYQAPTCEETGNEKYWQCTVCNIYFREVDSEKVECEYEDVILETIDHAVGENGTPATCTDSAICGMCKKPFGNANGHDWDYEKGTPTREATCSQTGIISYPCKNCDEVYNFDIDYDKTKHNWSEWSYNNDATCEENGTHTKTCKACEEEETEDDPAHPATGHDFGGEAVANEDGATHSYKCENPGCTEVGVGTEKGESVPCERLVVAACQDTVCKDCKRSLEATAEHVFTNYVSNDDATCIKDGTATAVCDVCKIAEDKKDIVGSKESAKHDLRFVEGFEATCEDDGQEDSWVCSVCDKIFLDDEGENEADEDSLVIKAKGHNWRNPTADDVDEYDWATAPTCVADGTMYQICTNCAEQNDKAVKIEGTINPDNHVGPASEELYNKKDATCTEAGYTGDTICSACGDTDHPMEKGQVINPLEHDYNYPETADEADEKGCWAEEPTCGKNGTAYKYCSRCDDVDKQSEPQEIADSATGEHEEGTPATCHDLAVCKNCEQPYGELAEDNHIWVIPTNDQIGDDDWAVEPDCETNGKAYQICQYHPEVKNSEAEAVEIADSALGHKLTKVDGTPATCEAEGKKDSWKCSQCDKIFLDEDGKEEATDADLAIKALGHDYTGTVKKNNDGTHSYLCKNGCNQYGGTVDCTAGEAVKENIKGSTSCEIPGTYDEVVYCTVCGYEMSRNEVTGQTTDHTPAAAVKENVKEASCTEDGSYDLVVYCSVCGEKLSSETVITGKTGHTAGAAQKVNVNEATCEADGSYDLVVRCTVCGEVLSSEHITAGKLGHVWVDGQVEKEASCTEDGVMVYTCYRCGRHDRTEPIPATGHTKKGTVDIEDGEEATCSKEGYYFEKIYCAVCEELYSTRKILIEKKAHEDNDHDGICDNCGTKVAEPDNCLCHKAEKNIFYKIVYRIYRAFWKLFKIKKYCECGKYHY